MLAAFAPIWALTAIGFLAGRSRALGPGAVDVLGRYVFYVAMPAALLSTLTRQPIGGFAGRGVAAFAIGTVLTCAFGFAATRWVFGRPLGEQAIGGMAAGYVNAANLGIPVAVQVLGSASFIAVVLLVQVLVFTPVVLALLDIARAEHPAGRWRRLLTLPLRSPLLLACVTGVALGAAGIRLPGLLDDAVALLGAAAVPTALIALGLSLVRARQEHAEPRRPREVAVAVLAKVVLQPVLTFAIASLGFGLTGRDLLAVVLCAALPTAQNTFVFARAYGVDGRFPRDVVVASTALSMVTLTLVATVLQ